MSTLTEAHESLKQAVLERFWNTLVLFLILVYPMYASRDHFSLLPSDIFKLSMSVGTLLRCNLADVAGSNSQRLCGVLAAIPLLPRVGVGSRRLFDQVPQRRPT